MTQGQRRSPTCFTTASPLDEGTLIKVTMRPPGSTGVHCEPSLAAMTAFKAKQTVSGFRLKISEHDVFGKGKFANAQGNTECVEFVRQATGAPHTSAWRKGLKVSEAAKGAIPRGTAIATFDAAGKYPSDKHGKHAAIYLEHDEKRILVLDQWNAQGEVLRRSIRFSQPAGTRRSNDGDTFYVIE